MPCSFSFAGLRGPLCLYLSDVFSCFLYGYCQAFHDKLLAQCQGQLLDEQKSEFGQIWRLDIIRQVCGWWRWLICLASSLEYGMYKSIQVGAFAVSERSGGFTTRRRHHTPSYSTCRNGLQPSFDLLFSGAISNRDIISVLLASHTVLYSIEYE